MIHASAYIISASGPKGGLRSKATHSPPLDQDPLSFAVYQQPLILKFLRNTTLPVQPHAGTGITFQIRSLHYNRGGPVSPSCPVR
jgi:hypothetical protein